MASSNQSDSKHIEDEQLREPTAEDLEQQKRKWRAFVNAQASAATFPLEIGDKVWIVQTGYRAPLGEFKVSKACPNDTFELIKTTDSSIHPELVDGKYLTRDPFRAA